MNEEVSAARNISKAGVKVWLERGRMKPNTGFDWLIITYMVAVPLTRQIPYHQLVSFTLTALVLIVYFLRTPAVHFAKRSWASPIAPVIAFYLATVLLCSLTSAYTADGFAQLGREALFFVVVFVVQDYAVSTKAWMNSLYAIIACGIFTAASVLGERLFAFGASVANDGRLAGIFYNPSAAGLVISVTFPIGIGYLQWRRFCGYDRHGLWISAATILALAASAVTVSRATMVSVLASAFLITVSRVTKVYYIILTALLVVFIYATGTQSFAERMGDALRLDQGLTGRAYLWERAWTLFKQSPIVGIGPSSYKYYVLSETGSGISRTEVDDIWKTYLEDETSVLDGSAKFGGVIGNSAHNLILDVASTTGVIGLLSLLAIFGMHWAVGRRAIKRLQPNGVSYWIVRASLVGLASFFLRSQFEPPGLLRGAVSESLLFWLTIVLVMRAPTQSMTLICAETPGLRNRR